MKAFWILVFLFFMFIAITFVLNMSYITSGVGLAVLMLFSVSTGYIFAPKWVKRIVMWGPIAWIMDFALSFGLTYGMGFSVTGFTAGIVFGLFVSLAIHYEQNRLKNEKRAAALGNNRYLRY